MPRPPPAPCAVPGCDRPSRAGGLCVSHYGQQRRGQPLRPIQPPQPRRVRVVAYLSPEVAAWLQERASAAGLTASEQLRRVVEQWAWVAVPRPPADR